MCNIIECLTGPGEPPRWLVRIEEVKMRFRSSTILSMTALAILSSLPLAAQAATAPMGGLTLSLTGVPSGATKVLVELEQPITHISVPNRLDFYVLAILPGGGPSMTAVVPPSQLLRRTA